MNKTRQTFLYVIFDLLAAIGSWTTFFLLRKEKIDTDFGNLHKLITLDNNYYYGLMSIPLCWLLLYFVQGYYKNVFKKSRLHEFAQTFGTIAFGSLVLFFVLLLDDFVVNYESYYKSILYLFSIQFLFTYIPRALITSITNKKIHSGKLGFNTLIIGSNDKALKLYDKISKKKKSSGNKFVGFVNVIEKDSFILSEKMLHLGSINDVKELIISHKIEEVIIAIESKEHQYLEQILYKLEGIKISIKAIPDNYDLISGRVKLSSLYDEPLILISHDLMPSWQENIKRLMDVTISILVLICCLPLYLFLAIGVKISSPGPIFYKQERIGIHGKPFYIYKFRSMYIGSEKSGPKLAKENDSRVTKFGQFIRKVRLDEIPQFYNVLTGSMSLVGPRPERQFYIDQITKEAPQYIHLLRVRPGITSWGQVKYGYASSVEEMVERLNYDIIYIENMSLYIDIKIMIYTVKTVILGKGL